MRRAREGHRSQGIRTTGEEARRPGRPLAAAGAWLAVEETSTAYVTTELLESRAGTTAVVASATVAELSTASAMVGGRG